MTAGELEREWDGMAVAGGFRRVNLPETIDWYIGLNQDGLPALMLISSVQPPSLRASAALGIAKRRRVGIDNRWTLVFDLKNADFRPVFAEFCTSLVNCALEAESEQTAIRLVTAQYRRWEAFFRHGRPRRFSETERRALLAHLLYLEKMVHLGTPVSDAVNAWVGPLGEDQDFRTAEKWTIVKPHRASESSVDIPSLSQLDAEPPGTLVLVRLGRGDTQGRRVTLAGTLNEVHALAESAYAGDVFAERLAATGYMPSEEADARPYVSLGFAQYNIDADFPRLSSASVPRGICSASYSIDISAITDWKEKDTGYDF